MSTIKLKSEPLQNAIKFLAEERKYHAARDVNEIVAEACLKFDLSPKDADFLSRFAHSGHHEDCLE